MHRGASRCLLLAHGAGSSADFLQRAFPAARCAAEVHPLEDRTGSSRQMARRLAEQTASLRQWYDQVFLGGVSIGAHAAALAGLRLGDAVDGYIFVMPGWIGPVDPAGPTARAASEIAAVGAGAVLHRLASDPATQSDWVNEELVRAWSHRPSLASELARAAAESAPGPGDLAALRGPCLVLGLDEDPVHPLAVARRWSELLQNSHLTVLSRQAPAQDRGVFGSAVGRWLGSLSAPR